MSCNGCRVLRKGCSPTCVLRPCLEWIKCPQGQCNATLFVSKFFGRRGLSALINAVPENRRSALFQSLLLEACGRIVNPADGAVGLLLAGNLHVCQAAVEKVLAGGEILQLVTGILTPNSNGAAAGGPKTPPMKRVATGRGGGLGRGRNYPRKKRQMAKTTSFDSGESSTSFESGGNNGGGAEKLGGNDNEPKLLNLFV